MISSDHRRRKPVQREYLSYSRPGAPDKGAKKTKPNEQARFAMKHEVVTHPRLSDGAVRLWVVLDDLSGFKGESWGSQAFLAANLGGIVDRVVRTRVAELVAAGYLRVVRKQRSCRYILGWVSDRNKYSSQEIQTGINLPPDWKKSSYQDPAFLTEPSIEPSTPKCTKCQDSGRVGGLGSGTELCTCEEGQAIHRRFWRRKRA